MQEFRGINLGILRYFKRHGWTLWRTWKNHSLGAMKSIFVCIPWKCYKFPLILGVRSIKIHLSFDEAKLIGSTKIYKSFVYNCCFVFLQKDKNIFTATHRPPSNVRRMPEDVFGEDHLPDRCTDSIRHRFKGSEIRTLKPIQHEDE